MKNRNHTIDIIRIIAMLEVIMLHVKSTTTLAEDFTHFFWPLPVSFFIITSLTYFLSGLTADIKLDHVLIKMFRRIILPFLSWSFLYYSLLCFNTILMQQHISFSLWRIFIYGQSAVQMYYLPLLVALQIIVLGLHLLFFNNHKDKIIGFFFVISGISYFIVGDIFDCFGVSTSGQYIGIGIYLIFTFYLARIIGNISPLKISLMAFGIILIFITEFFNTYKIYFTVYDYWVLLPIGGIGLLVLAIVLSTEKLPRWIITISDATYGIYFCHVVFLEAFELFCKKVLKMQIIYDLPTKLLVVILIFILSYFFTVILKKNKFTRIVFLGEK